MIVTKMYHATTSLRSAIHAHPFNQKLADGSLNRNIFNHYIQQDALYLIDFAKSLAIAAGRLDNSHYSRSLLDFSLQAIWAEKDLHQFYINDPNITHKISQSPACFMYTNYILKTANMGAIEEVIACLLPCFVIYRDVGQDLVKNLVDAKHPYHAWITLYAGEEFAQAVDTMCLITNELAETASNMVRDKMIAAFVKSTQLEWLFWDGAYHQRDWAC